MRLSTLTLFIAILLCSACGGSGGHSPAAPGSASIDHLSYVATGAPSDVYYPSSATYQIDVLITNDGNVNSYTHILASMNGTPMGTPVIPSLNVGDSYIAHISLAPLVGQPAGVYTVILTTADHPYWSQTYLINVHFGSSG